MSLAGNIESTLTGLYQLLEDDLLSEEVREVLEEQQDELNEQFEVAQDYEVSEATENFQNALMALQEAQEILEESLEDISLVDDVVEKLAVAIDKVSDVLE